MTKEKLLERKADLQKGLEAIINAMKEHEGGWRKLNDTRIANINAIQEIDHWLKELEKEAQPEAEPKSEAKKGK